MEIEVKNKFMHIYVVFERSRQGSIIIKGYRIWDELLDDWHLITDEEMTEETYEKLQEYVRSNG